ncbi:MAG: nitroreductase family protein [Candidatus Helarchaeales archaeon]
MANDSSNILEVIKSRRSVRRFSTKKVDKKILKEMLEAARWAPSAGNRQPVEILVIQNEEMRKKISELTGHKRYEFCPVIFLACINNERAKIKYGKKIGEYLAIIDSAIAVQNMMLVAAAHGLGTSWGDVIGAQKQAVRELFNLPDFIEPFTFIPIGYPGYEEGQGGSRAERRKLEEMVHWETW